MKHLDELTATLRMVLMFMLALLGIAWGSAKLFTLMGVPVAGSWLLAMFLVTIIGLVLSDKWRKLQKDDAQKSAEPPSTEEPGSVIVDQLETGQLVLARENKRKAARTFRVPKSAFVSVLDGLPLSQDDDYVIQFWSGGLRCVRRGVRYWKEEGTSGDTFFDSDRKVVRYARIDTSKRSGVVERPPETADDPHDTIKFWAATGGCLVTLATGQTKWVKEDICELGEHAGLWRSIQGWGPKHGPFKEVCDGLPKPGFICLVELDDGTRAVRERPIAGHFWESRGGGETFFDPGAIASYRGPFVVRYAELIGTHVTKRMRVTVACSVCTPGHADDQ